jgi:hypothetical protein
MTLAQLFTPADLLANAAATILRADAPVAFPFPVYTPRQFAQQNINRVEIAATGFARASDHMDLANVVISNVDVPGHWDNSNPYEPEYIDNIYVVTYGAVPFYNHHRGQLAFTVITARNDQQTADNHAFALGRIGYLCSRPAQTFTTSACSGLVILDLEDEGTAPTEDEKADTDRTTRTFTVEFMIPAAIYAAAT